MGLRMAVSTTEVVVTATGEIGQMDLGLTTLILAALGAGRGA